MIRTVWLALVCLIAVGALATLKAGVATPAKQQAELSDNVIGTAAEALPKADRLDVGSVKNVPDEKTVKTTTIISPNTDDAVPNQPAKISKIISRHWHEGYTKMAKRSAIDRHASPKPFHVDQEHSFVYRTYDH
jgi:hypothetical protein